MNTHVHNWRPGETITAAKLRSGYASGTVVLDFSTGGTLSAASSAYDQDIRTQSVVVNFPAGRFTEAPAVTVAAESNSPNMLEVRVFGVTATQFTIYGERATGAATPIKWIAIEES